MVWQELTRWGESKEYQYTAKYEDSIIHCCRTWHEGTLFFCSQRQVHGGVREVKFLAPSPSRRDWNVFCDAMNQYCKEIFLAEKEAFEELQRQYPGSPKQSSRTLEISIDVPMDASAKEISRIAAEAAVKADAVHRANGGNGLQVDTVKLETEEENPRV